MFWVFCLIKVTRKDIWRFDFLFRFLSLFSFEGCIGSCHGDFYLEQLCYWNFVRNFAYNYVIRKGSLLILFGELNRIGCDISAGI